MKKRKKEWKKAVKVLLLATLVQGSVLAQNSKVKTQDNLKLKSEVKINTTQNLLQKSQQEDSFKTMWIKSHPTEYRAIGGIVTEPNRERVAESANDQVAISADSKNKRKEIYYCLPHIPSFPGYINSGDIEKDNADYKSKKDQWIAQNQELYNELTNSSTVKNKVQTSK